MRDGKIVAQTFAAQLKGNKPAMSEGKDGIMAVGLLLIAVVLIAGVLCDTFETIILPRRVTRRFRLPRLFYRATWVPWSALARHVPAGNQRESFLSFFGPFSLLLLFEAWALSLILGFALCIGRWARQSMYATKLLTFGRTCT
jgi:hypothetical protein